MQLIKDAWQGNAKLWQVFWLGILVPFTVLFLFAFTSILFHDYSYNLLFKSRPWMFFRAVYFILWGYCVFKCSNNTDKKGWKYAAFVGAFMLVVTELSQLVMSAHPAVYNQACLKPIEDFAVQNGLNVQDYMAKNDAYLQKCTKDLYETTCKQTMQDFAQKNKLDPQAYIAGNSAYLRQCVQSLQQKEETAAKRR